MKIDELLGMIDGDLGETADTVSSEGSLGYLEEVLLNVLNNQHTILLALRELLTAAKHEGKVSS